MLVYGGCYSRQPHLGDCIILAFQDFGHCASFCIVINPVIAEILTINQIIKIYRHMLNKLGKNDGCTKYHQTIVIALSISQNHWGLPSN